MKREALLAPIPIRFSDATKRRLSKTAKRFGLNSSEIVRRAVEHKLPEWESGDKLIIKAKEVQ